MTKSEQETYLKEISLHMLYFQSFEDDTFSFRTLRSKEKVLDSIKNDMMLETTIRNIIFIVPTLLSIFRNRKFNFYTISFLVFTALHLLTFFFFGKNINEVTLAIFTSLSFLNNLIEMLFCSGYKITSGLKEIGFVYTVFNLLCEAGKTFIVYCVFNDNVNNLTLKNSESSAVIFSSRSDLEISVYEEYYDFLIGLYVILFIENLFKMLRLKKTLNKYYDNKNEKNKFSFFWMFIRKCLYFGFVYFINKLLFLVITKSTIEKEIEKNTTTNNHNKTITEELFECVYQVSSLEYYVSLFYNIFSCIILDVASSKELVFGDVNTKSQKNEELI